MAKILIVGVRSCPILNGNALALAAVVNCIEVVKLKEAVVLLSAAGACVARRVPAALARGLWPARAVRACSARGVMLCTLCAVSLAGCCARAARGSTSCDSMEDRLRQRVWRRGCGRVSTQRSNCTKTYFSRKFSFTVLLTALFLHNYCYLHKGVARIARIAHIAHIARIARVALREVHTAILTLQNCKTIQ